MTDNTSTTPNRSLTTTPQILVPLQVIEGESLSAGVIDLLRGTRVILLGYHVVPEQTPPDQARAQYETTVLNTLDGFAEQLQEVGIDVDVHLVFTRNADQTINRIAAETNVIGILLPRPAPRMDSLLVAVRDLPTADRIGAVAGMAAVETDVSITILTVTASQDIDPMTILDRTRQQLRDYGVASDRITTRSQQSTQAIETIIEAATDFDAVVMGESDASLSRWLFGASSDRVADRSVGPVLVVRNL